MARVTYEAVDGGTETLDCDYAGPGEDGVFLVCLDKSDGEAYKTRIPVARIVRINEQVGPGKQ